MPNVLYQSTFVLGICCCALPIHLCVFTSALSANAEESTQELFNGHDLSGWDGDLKLWKVEDGLLTGTTTSENPIEQNTFAVWTGGEVGDFELNVVFRMSENQNSGVQYRSERIPGSKWGIKGYQADLHPLPKYAGMLYEEEGRKIIAEAGQRVTLNADNSRVVIQPEKKPLTPDFGIWNELNIKAAGNRLVHTLNGNVTADVTDFDAQHAKSRGLLALQLHTGPPMKVQFKSITLRRIAPAKTQNNEPEKQSVKCAKRRTLCNKARPHHNG